MTIVYHPRMGPDRLSLPLQARRRHKASINLRAIARRLFNVMRVAVVRRERNVRFFADRATHR